MSTKELEAQLPSMVGAHPILGIKNGDERGLFGIARSDQIAARRVMQVVGDRRQTLRLGAALVVADDDVAAVADSSPDFSGLVTVVDRESRGGSQTDGADALLQLAQMVESVRPTPAVAVPHGSDPFLGGPGRDGLADGPFEGSDQPRVAAEVHLLGAVVDAFGEVVGQPQVNVFRHAGHSTSTCTCNSSGDSIPDITHPLRETS